MGLARGRWRTGLTAARTGAKFVRNRSFKHSTDASTRAPLTIGLQDSTGDLATGRTDVLVYHARVQRLGWKPDGRVVGG
ncbi:hypothetical protein [Streptomyces sp. PA5.6]|uniref:hypothetical protein n=1 Tax=Streptomyces sp. PA5.6 TaxID=3035651 RepID=UPI003904D92F